jgi:methyl-accepting chemotaxis protein
MKNLFTLKGSFVMYFLTLCLLSFFTIGALWHLSRTQAESYAATNLRIKALKTEAESTMLDLLMIQAMRAFVVTGDAKFEKEYKHYLAMAQGKVPRFYGEVTTTTRLLKELGMPDNVVSGNLAKYGDEMYKMEDTAFYAAKGLYDDGNGHYTQPGPVNNALGIELLFSSKYFDLAAKSNAGVSAFLKDKIKESETREATAEKDAVFAERIVFMMLFLMLGVSVIALFMVYRMIRQSVIESLQVAELLATGDLTATLNTQKQDELGRLMQAINGIGHGLAIVVGNVRSGVLSINTASREIASGNTDLADRTAQQASSLEKISQAMVALTSTVQQNADNARQANQLVTTTAELAERGGAVVNTVVQTMDGIKSSSARISEIINVIDGISFQTNILALNAAVEAARAGEQGRGFAVVASEVRVLAQRSAAAAKEISELITDSVSKVNTGGHQVDQAGTTMNEIVSAVRQVVDIMSEILAASKEQNEGINQVSLAIEQLDDMTQQNSALVEQAAAASESLLDQADNLEQAVKVFKTKGGERREQSPKMHTPSATHANTKKPHTTTIMPSTPVKSRTPSSEVTAVTAVPVMGHHSHEVVVSPSPSTNTGAMAVKKLPRATNVNNEEGWDEF